MSRLRSITPPHPVNIQSSVPATRKHSPSVADDPIVPDEPLATHRRPSPESPPPAKRLRVKSPEASTEQSPGPMSSSSLGAVGTMKTKRALPTRAARHSSGQVSGQLSWSMAITVDESGDAELDESIPSSPLKELRIPSYWATGHLISPELDLTGSVTKLDAYPYDSGGAADIYRGVLDASEFPELLTGTTFPELLTGTRFPELLTRNSFDSAGFSNVYRVMLNECDIPVAIKVFRRLHTEPQQLESKSKSLYEVARNFKRLNHPNILPFLGISLDLGLSPALITPLCSSGPVMKYLKSNTKNPREKLQIGAGLAEGLAYLHSQGITHGNLCTKKVLIDKDGKPVICGYGLCTILGPVANTTSLFSFPIRFSAPEYFSDESGASSVRTTAGDVYAFSMVMLEILSGREPYYTLPTEHAVFKHILRGQGPTRSDYRTLTDRSWTLLTSLWDQSPYLRPAMSDVVISLIQIDEFPPPVTLLSPGAGSLRGPPAPSHSNRRERAALGNVSSADSDDAETDDYGDLKGRITQDDQYPFAGGGNANIYRGKFTRLDGRKIRVAIKMIRMSDDASIHQEAMLKSLDREVQIWRSLRHKNILPFIGVCNDLAPLPVLVSPLCKFGHVGKYINKYPEANRSELILGIAEGLEFLHNKGVVHGDLKVQNVLVNKHGVPRICDFGISKIVNLRGFTISNVGTAPYMAPELLFVVDGLGTSSQELSFPSTTTSSDVYSFALLVLEILTTERPKGRPTKPIVTAKIFSELRPMRMDYDEVKVSKRIWSVLDKCWSFEPLFRPSITHVLHSLSGSFASDIAD